MKRRFVVTPRTKVTAAFDDFSDIEEFRDDVEDLQDAAEDIQEAAEDVSEDSEHIEIDNNIEDHYIAECDKCQGIFISALVESDQEVSKISGICPLCGEESDQYLNWIIRDANSDESEEILDV